MLQSAVPTARTTARSTSHAGALRLSVLGVAAALALSACNESQDKPPQAASAPLQPATESAQPVATPVAYVPPSAETLYQMVAPIALYPDKLVAQVLAASTYPDQVGAAEVWMGQNPGLKPEELQNAVNSQDWDPSVKSLAQFPNVLAQLSSNVPWTTALGKAYYNDPADVMNAIQVMRQRAYKAGTLKDSSRLKVAVATAEAPPPVPQPAPQAVGEPLSSMLPVPVIDTPPQFIEIAPAQPDTVYVPQYDPGVVYGEPVPMYGGYRPIVAPQPVYVGSSAAPVVAGLIGFGAGVILAESVDRRPWGWNSWGMRWGEPGYRWHRNEPPPPPSRRPAVIYNNNTYVSRSTTVVQNIHNTHINNVGNVTHIANNPHFEPRSGDSRSGDPRSGGMAAAALAGAAGMAGAAAAAHSGMPQRLGLRPPQGGPPPSAQGMVPPGGAQGFARHDGADRGRPGLRPDDRPQASLQPRMNPVPASQPGQFGKWPQSPQSAQSAPSSPPGTAQRPAPALPAAAMQGDRGRDSRVPSWSSAATQQGVRPQDRQNGLDRQDRDRSMADAARQRQQQQQQMETQAARLRGEEQARQQQQRQAQMQAQAQMRDQARDQAQVQAQAQARQQAERDRQALQQRSQDQARQQQMQQQQQQARAQEQMQARMQAQQQAQQQAQRQAQMQERQAQQQRQQQFEAAQQQRMQAQQAQQAQAQARAQQQQARAQQEQRQQQQRMANAARPQERRGGRDERRDR